jgi:hypothetical protein
VRFSGKLTRDGTDGVREVSLGEKGSMTSPEFLMRFTSVEAIDAPAR